jgi:hypothetical protein
VVGVAPPGTVCSWCTSTPGSVVGPAHRRAAALVPGGTYPIGRPVPGGTSPCVVDGSGSGAAGTERRGVTS